MDPRSLPAGRQVPLSYTAEFLCFVISAALYGGYTV